MKCLYPIADNDVHVFMMPVINSNMYVLIKMGAALIIDPCVSSEAEYLLSSNKVAQCTILLTHEHYDHISGINRLRKLFGCKVICSLKCADLIGDSHKNGASTFGALFLSHGEGTRNMVEKLWDPEYYCRADEVYKDKKTFLWQELKVEIQETPGHSPGSQIIKINDKNVFSGDSLIPGQKTITRLPGGSKKIFIEKTLPYIEKLDIDSVIYPGHYNVVMLRNLKITENRNE